jgi:hypothetical protein
MKAANEWRVEFALRCLVVALAVWKAVEVAVWVWRHVRVEVIQ